MGKKTFSDYQLENASDDELMKQRDKIESRLFKKDELDDEEKLAMVGDYAEDAKELIQHWGKFYGLSTGINSIDKLTYGILPGELIIMGGVPAIGKSMFLLNVCAAMASSNLCTFVSLELTHAQVYARLNQLGDPSSMNIVLQKELYITKGDFEKIAEEAAEGGSKVLFLDYLQMLTGDDENEAREIGNIVRKLKMIAIKHDMIVIAISSLNRARDEGELKNTSLMGSGKIEFYADMIWFLERNADNEIIWKITKNRSNPIEADTELNKAVLSFNGARFNGK